MFGPVLLMVAGVKVADVAAPAADPLPTSTAKPIAGAATATRTILRSFIAHPIRRFADDCTQVHQTGTGIAVLVSSQGRGQPTTVDAAMGSLIKKRRKRMRKKKHKKMLKATRWQR